MATCPPLTAPSRGTAATDGPPHRGDQPLPVPAAQLARERALGLLVPVAAFFLSWWQVGRIPGTNISISDVLLFLALALAVSLGGLNARFFGRFTALWAAGLTMLLGGMLVGSMAHGDFMRWPIVAGQYTFAMLIVPMLLTSCPHRVLERSASAYILGVAASQVIGITLITLFERAQITGFLNKYVVTGSGRLGAMTGEPNSNGAVCAFALVYLLHATKSGRIHALPGIGLALVLIAGLLYSASFTGTFAAMLACALVLGFSRLRTSIAIAAPLALVLGAYVSFGGPVPALFEQRVGDALLTGDPTRAGTFVGRSALITEAWGMADDNLLIGLGSDGYRKASPHGMPVHQLYLLVLNEGGLTSFLGLFLMALALLLQGQAITRANRFEGIACLAVLAIFFIYTMSLPHMFARLWNGPVMLMFALGWITTRRPRTTALPANRAHAPGSEHRPT